MGNDSELDLRAGVYLCVEGSILLPVDGSGPRGELRGKETKIYGDRTEVETRGPLVLGGKRERRARPTLKFR